MEQAELTYRHDIDGLRAVAVLGVVLCHAGLGVTGGFVGVDVFFVISGYLITTLILKDLDRNAFSLLNFWERRVRRIGPALISVTFATLLAGWFITPPAVYADLGQSVVALVLVVSNVHFYRQAGYFAAASGEKPLLHTWSLAVEEQFYFFIPVFLLVLARLRRLRHAHAVFTVMTLLSFALSVYGVRRNPDATFYLLPTRAWELFAGVLIAIRPARWPHASRRRAEAAAACGISLIILHIIIYNEYIQFPGILALPPVLGTALLITSGAPSPRRPLTNRLLTWRPLVFVGLISYSLYLWHWPLIALARIVGIHQLRPLERALIVAASAALAVLSWHFIEAPFRRRRGLASRRRLFATAALAGGVLLASGLTLWRSRGFDSRVPPTGQLFAATNQ